MKSIMHTSLILFFALVCLPQIGMAQSATSRTVLTEAEFNNASHRMQQEVLNNPDKFIVVKDGQKVDVWNSTEESSPTSPGSFNEGDILQKAVSEGKVISKEDLHDLPELKNPVMDATGLQNGQEKAAVFEKPQNNLGQKSAETEEIMEDAKLQLISDQKHQEVVEKEKQMQEAKARRERLIREKEMQPEPQPKQYSQEQINNMTPDEQAEYEGKMEKPTRGYVKPTTTQKDLKSAPASNNVNNGVAAENASDKAATTGSVLTPADAVPVNPNRK